MYGHNLGDKEIRSDYKAVGGIHLVDIHPGNKANLWAKFPAAPPDGERQDGRLGAADNP